MTKRQEVLKFAKFNRITAKPMCGGVLLHKANGADWRNDFSRAFDSWDEAHRYLRDQINAVKDGELVSYPWDAHQ